MLKLYADVVHTHSQATEKNIFSEIAEKLYILFEKGVAKIFFSMLCEKYFATSYKFFPRSSPGLFL